MRIISFSEWSDLCKEYEDKYELAKDNGCANNGMVIKLTVPESKRSDYLSPTEYLVNTMDFLEKLFPNAIVDFGDVEEIEFTFNVVKTV
ncbi:head protein [Acinetobacter phage AP22]|uniref:Uncharacterized protein n=1 Tax=Acinetobacter phage AP22 TaxID=1187128 RepID=I2GUA8_9CAUD|nr:head protein [Acinetobacter phage AP22]CCH57709.1 hypothetical protein [Acinetobacter phage AP22]